MNKLKERLKLDAIIQWGVVRLDAIRFGKHKISLYRFFQILYGKLEKDHILEMSRSMAYSFVLSIFPAILFLFTLIPHIPIDKLDASILHYLKQVLPAGIYEVAESTIYDIVARPRSGLMSFGFLFTVYAAVNGIVAMIAVFNKCYRTIDNRSFIKRIFISVQILFLLVFCLVSSIALEVAIQLILTYIDFDNQIKVVFLSIIGFILPYLLLLFSISFIYSLAPAVSKRWRFFSAGSFVAAFLTMLFSFLFILYFNNFSSYNKLYGSIGALIGLMLWIFSVSAILLIGFEINASLDIAYREKSAEIKQ